MSAATLAAVPRPSATETFEALRALLRDLRALDAQMASANSRDLPAARDMVVLFDRTVDQALALSRELEERGVMDAMQKAIEAERTPS